MSEKLSISIITMNNMEMNRNCLRSIFEYSQGFSFKVFVLDNNSKDGTVNMIKEEFPQVELIESNVNRWFTSNQNIVLKRVQTEYVLLLNNDTLFLDDSIKLMVDFLETHEDAGAVACKILNPDHSFQKTTLRCDYDLLTNFSIKTGLVKLFPKNRIWGRPFMGYADREAVQQIDVYSGACVMFRKKVIDDTGLLDENISFGPDDYDYSLRMRKKGWKIYYLPTAKVIHLDKQTRKTNSEFLLEEVKGILYFYLKHYGKLQTFILQILMLYGALLKPVYWIYLILCRKLTLSELKDNCAIHLKFLKLVIFYSGAKFHVL
ncbi:MAG: glycosyltransferase family 2 protein [Candidatus Omnitrophota bacterium]